MNNDNFTATAKKTPNMGDSSFGNMASDSATDIKSKTKQMFGSVQDSLGNVQDSVESVKNRINDKPLQSTLIALGIGFVISRLLRS